MISHQYIFFPSSKLSDHRKQDTVYIGLHLPRHERRHRHRHGRHKSHRRDEARSGPNSGQFQEGMWFMLFCFTYLVSCHHRHLCHISCTSPQLPYLMLFNSSVSDFLSWHCIILALFSLLSFSGLCSLSLFVLCFHVLSLFPIPWMFTSLLHMVFFFLN